MRDGNPPVDPPRSPPPSGGDEPPYPDDAEPDTALLKGRNPREVLARLCAGDPLQIAARCQVRISERAVLVDPTRLAYRAVARVAYQAMVYRGHPPLAVFLRSVIDGSVDELLREDSERERAAVVGEGDDSELHRFVVDLLGVEPHLARRGALAFNALGQATRAAFFRVAVEGYDLESAADVLRCDAAQLRDRLRTAIAALSRSTGEDPESLESRWGVS